ncbi:hypothetical protein EDD37DRAFT_164789 [Exophiala viscosa]|uniref:uncharacterized protein n=1 Tax=Exophiala viscosa TaxID=2486360 RepID=UPI0021909386|nr:hypothetical protein EDD37DRAFT_164789 [Exophiala viscosa]
MSWKLAELRWRQEVGLQETCWERNNKILYGSNVPAGTACRPTVTGRRRSQTMPSCGNSSDYISASVDQGLSASSQLSSGGFRPHPDTLALPSVSALSTTPLLKFTQTRPEALLQDSGYDNVDDSHLETHDQASQFPPAGTLSASHASTASSPRAQFDLREKGSLFPPDFASALQEPSSSSATSPEHTTAAAELELTSVPLERTLCMPLNEDRQLTLLTSHSSWLSITHSKISTQNFFFHVRDIHDHWTLATYTEFHNAAGISA